MVSSEDVSHDSVYEDCVYLLFKPHDMDLFRDFIDSEYERTDNIVEDYDYEGGYVVVVYKLDENFKKGLINLLDKDCIPKPVRTFKIYSQRL
jgi:hypothetical protein